ncbi:outer membrane protein assembly factor BamB [Paenibacillus sp. UNC496MF]|uniref:outer membrane protein assembly factor BamB family protein n=1 Tax=Paenibacillus sp. UNC496MF TaxID=1502753 RepID=UPI0008E8BED4|nr:PQQ-binding-like beta-propeller repeat protein [Paenibacillus sp. UNC496MF]SFI75407.1 outer membrane protein assembly factor BamB [Paenibacillus sp. UNC496MF]
MRPMKLASVVLALTILGSATTVLADSAGRHAPSGGRGAAGAALTPDAAMAWTHAADQPGDEDPTGGGRVAADAQRVFFLERGKLTAVMAGTGKTLWSSGAKLKAPLLASGGRIYAMSEDGRAVEVDAKTGRTLWTADKPVPDARKLYANGGRLYVQGTQVAAFRLADGAFLWKQGEFYGDLLFAGHYLLASSVDSGAYSSYELHAIDVRSGKQAWQLANESLPIDVRGGIAYAAREQTIMDHALLTTLDAIDLATGKIVKSRVYNPEGVNPAAVVYYGPGQLMLQGDDVFVAYGHVAYRYPLNADPSKVRPDVYVANQARGLRYAAGPYDGRLLFSDGDGIYGVKTADGARVSYNAGLEKPIARFDLIGQGLYVAQTDGALAVVDLATGRPAMRVRTGAQVTGPTLKAGDMIIVQAKGKLLAFKEPAGLSAKRAG